MRFTLSWLKQFLDTDATLEQITHTLTMTGLEVEDVVDHSEDLAEFTVAEIISTKAHPDADKLQICQVSTGDEILQIICGAANARSNIKVVLAKVGTLIPNGSLKIKKAKIRGVESCGMLCSADELNIGTDSAGIIELDKAANLGEKCAKYLNFDDPVIHINITPNRADGLGVYGIARDLAAAGIGKLKKLQIPTIKEEFNTNITLHVKDQKACTLFAMRVIKDIENIETPIWLKNYLENIGVGSISPVVDVTNYIAYTFGQPMHAYDAAKISNQINVEVLDSDYDFQALNDKEYKLNAGDLVIRDDKKVHCLAGIIGSTHSACDENTKTVILEAANFNAEHITKAGRRLIIDTDSRYRFERNVDREFTLQALDYATDLIISICSGRPSQLIMSGSTNLPVRTLQFSTDFLQSKTGINLNAHEIDNILTKLGFKCKTDRQKIDITIPSWRYDVTIKEDIVEEVLRIYSYDKIPQIKLPQSSISKVITQEERRISDIKRLLASLGYDEVISWSFMDQKKASLFTHIQEGLTLLNPISSDLNYMRPGLLPNLLQIAHNNINRSFKDLSLYEIGPVFLDANDKHVLTHAAGIKTGYNMPKNNHAPNKLWDAFDIKTDMAEILDMNGLNIDKCKINNNVPSYYHPTRSASFSLGRNILGYFGQIHPLVLKEFKIDMDVMVFELDLSKLPLPKNKYGRKPDLIVSDYQMINRDYAFIINKDQPIGEILTLIKNIDKKLIKSVSLFDIYSGDKIDNNKKSIALSVHIQDNHKTLTENDIKAINDAIISGIQTKFDATLRDS